MTGNIHTLLSPTEVWDRVDPLATDLGADPPVAGLAALPYAQLLGPGFERLCYELLVAEGYSPRFFGLSGQRDYGVDVILEVDKTRTVFQCKNLAKAPTFSDVRNAVTKFQTDWVQQAGLRPPDRFIYCCSQSLKDIEVGRPWTTFKDEFLRDTGVEVLFWDKDALDTRLRALPDIVAGLFSDSYAEHFCGRDRWRLDDPWTRVRWGEPRYASIKRFLDRHARRTIAVSEQEQERFLDLVTNSPVVAIRGFPGSGKTTCALELGCRLRDPLRRIYYATLEDSAAPERLWQSVRRRGSLPALFVLDDCHRDLKLAGIIQERLAPEFKNGATKLLLVLRDLPGSTSGEIDDTPEWLTQLEQDGAVIDMKTDLNRTCMIIDHLRPDLAGLSAARLKRIHHFCGGDLLLLDELLSDVASPTELDAIRPDRVYGQIRSRYFEGNRILPTIRTLACLAQFELLPTASFFDGGWQPGEKDLAAPLMTTLFAPPRYQFLHSSLAELVLRAQVELENATTDLEDAVEAATKTALRAYFHHLLSSGDMRMASGIEFMAFLETMLRGSLKLADGPREARIKADVLADEAIRTAVESHLQHCTFAFLHLCLISLFVAANAAKDRYVNLVEKRFAILFQHRDHGSDERGLESLGFGLFTLSIHAPASRDAVLHEHGAGGYLRLIAANGTLIELFKLLEYATPAFQEALLGLLDEATVGALVAKTIEVGRSVGTLSLAMRELGNADAALLGHLEQRIGAERFLRLIVANGNLFDLFRILMCATPAFRDALLGQSGEATVRTVVAKTIAAGRSIGTLSLAMRELGNADPALPGHLEQSIGAEHFLRLITANGTLFDLFKILEYGTPDFRQALLGQLDDATAGALVAKTIAAGRSIGTFNLAMRELGNADMSLLGRLEQSIGAERFLHLIAANGTLFDLFKILMRATPAFREALVGLLNEATVGALVAKTIEKGRSIGTLSLAIRELRNADSALLGHLEQSVGAERFLRLIAANGSLHELFDIIHYSTFGFGVALLCTLDGTTTSTLVAKTVRARRSIQSFHFGLGRFAKDSNLRSRLEELVGIQGWWQLIVNLGTLNDLSQISNAMSDGFRARFITASFGLSVPDWRGIIVRGLFLNACTFAMDEVAAYPPASKVNFCKALGETATELAAKARWFDLNPSRPPVDPDAEEGCILREALRHRIAGIMPGDLSGLDFREAVNALAFAWRERIDLRPVLAERLWDILPAPANWPRKEGEVAALRFVLSIARSETISPVIAQQLLAATGSFLDPEVCADIDTLPLFLLVWNMAALRYQRGSDRSFDRTLPTALIETLLDVLRDRIHPKGPNEEKVAQLGLAGLLGFLLPQLSAKLRARMAPLRGATPWLSELALEQTFVPALFALEGIALLQPGNMIFTPLVSMGLLMKSKQYEDIGPAVEHLRERVKRYGKRR